MAELSFPLPVRARLDASGHLLYADPPLLALQVSGGGTRSGALVVPGLWDLCKQSRDLNMNLSRAVRTGTENRDIRLWAETRLSGNQLELLITGWQESPIERSDFAGHVEDDPSSATGGSMRLDSGTRIISIALAAVPRAPQLFTGKRMLEAFSLLGSPQGHAALLEKIAERQPFGSMDFLLLDGSDRQYEISGSPLIDKQGNFAGYHCRLSKKVEPGNDMAHPDTLSENALISNAVFGAQLGPALRQPLNKIIANAETISAKLQGPLRQDYAVYASDIANAGRHLLSLVDDLADLEAIERDNFTVASDDIDLVDLAHRTAGLLAVKAADHRITLILPDKDHSVPAIGEFRRVLQILVNLVGNAIRYSPDGSAITIEAASHIERASISVTDEGDGIAPEDQARIFEKFERLGRKGDGGSGLGLYISRRLARAMHGELIVQSKAGAGTRFTLFLPMKPKP